MTARIKLASAKHHVCNVCASLRQANSILEKLEIKVRSASVDHEIFELVRRRTSIPVDDSQVHQRVEIDLLWIVLVSGINRWKEAHMHYDEKQLLKINRRALIEETERLQSLGRQLRSPLDRGRTQHSCPQKLDVCIGHFLGEISASEQPIPVNFLRIGTIGVRLVNSIALR